MNKRQLQSIAGYNPATSSLTEQSQLRAEAPIGVFDSGAGGLTILAHLRQELPFESFIYFGDTANCPYGVRSDAKIIELTTSACRFLIEQGVKLIVIACNTASQAALSHLRATFPALPFVGVVPAVKPATRLTSSGRIGIAATNQAAKAAYLRGLIEEFASGINVYAEGCPGLVTLVEQGKLTGSETEAVVRAALTPLIRDDIDVLVLGCTHFPALRPIIEQVMGAQVKVIDSGSAIARRTRTILTSEGMLHPELSRHSKGEMRIWCSGDPYTFSAIASQLLGEQVSSATIGDRY